jgi:hypothetical protein
MEDMDGPMIAASVYKRLFGGCSDSLQPDDIAYALDEAVQELRKSHSEPSRWATYVHFGI